MKNEVTLYFIGALTAFFSVVNPLSTMPVFLALTVKASDRHRISMAKKSAFFMVLILLGFLIAGSFVMNFFGISLEGIRIAGGIIILRSGYMLLNTVEKPNLTTQSREEGLSKQDISLTPLAIPLLAGPGSMAVTISMSTNVAAGEFYKYLLIALAIVLIAFLVYLSFRYSAKLLPILGSSGLEALTKIIGFITMTIGVEFIIRGVKPLFNI
ncbi:MAG: NAAT family transporter [Bacteroidetes bacterium]|nr:NAAT family transporter [Bacteroidota bacterium]